MELGFNGKVFAFTSESKIPRQNSFFVEELHKTYNKSQKTIAQRLQLLYLPKDLQSAVEIKTKEGRKRTF